MHSRLFPCFALLGSHAVTRGSSIPSDNGTSCAGGAGGGKYAGGAGGGACAMVLRCASEHTLATIGTQCTRSQPLARNRVPSRDLYGKRKVATFRD